MEQKYKEFLNYNFTDNEQFRRYLDAIEPPPPHSMIDRYKKKFYRLKVDKDFDIDYEPEKKVPLKEKGKSANAVSTFIPWATKLQLILFAAFLLTFPIGYLLKSYYHMAPLSLAFLIGVLKKHGRPTLSSQYWELVIVDDHLHDLVNTIICTLSFSCTIALYIPLLLRTLLFMAEFVSLAAKKRNNLAKLVNKLTGTISTNRESLLIFKADFEVCIGFYLIIALIMRWAPLTYIIFYWQFLYIRYSLSPYITTSFNKLAIQIDSITSHSSCPFFIKWPLKGLRRLGSFMVGITQQLLKNLMLN